MRDYKILTDIQLTALLKEDDKSAFAEIYARYASQLTAFTASRLYKLDDARDLIQDLFVKIWTQRHTHEIDRNLKAFLFSVTRRRIVDQIRKNIHHEAYAHSIQQLEKAYGAFTEEQLMAKELEKHIQNSLEELTPGVRKVYKMSREADMSIEQIARQLQVSPQTVKNQLSSALKHLRQALSAIRVLFM